MDAAASKQQLRRLRTLGCGASGAVVWLATDDATGQLLAVKSAGPGTAAAERLRHEARVQSALRSPHIVRCLGSRAGGGEYQLFLEFAPGGSLADEAARSAGGRIPERDVRRHAADVARALAYLHGDQVSLVHGDVKAANVVVGADGRAKLADFGCARPAVGCCDRRPLAGSPAFMAPEVARGEEQGPPADVWALACTVIEMATGAAPWSDADDVYPAVHRIAYTDAVPETPAWLSSEAKDFLRVCLQRNPRQRPSAAQLLDHPFLVSAEPAKHGRAWATASPKSTLNVELWDSDDDEEEEASESATGRISSLASPRSALPDLGLRGWLDRCAQRRMLPAPGLGGGRCRFWPQEC